MIRMENNNKSKIYIQFSFICGVGLFYHISMTAAVTEMVYPSNGFRVGYLFILSVLFPVFILICTTFRLSTGKR